MLPKVTGGAYASEVNIMKTAQQIARSRRKTLMRHARSAKRLAATQAPRPPRKPRRKSRARFPKRTVRKAIEGSYGNQKTIQARLGCAYSSVRGLLNRKGWEDLRLQFELEKERLNDLAEDVLVDTMEGGAHPAVASANARWVLERRGKSRGFGKEETLKIQGGDRPITVEHTVPIENLDLPLDTRRMILEAIERQEPKMIEGRIVE